ncbi:MAG: DUF4362 domain-containing protein [Acidobacteria bacterium]|nr:DUF4362 domain-containing protein [Acidobacteriota bacterium]
MKPIVCIVTILFAVGTHSAASLSNPSQGSSKDKTSSAQREKNPPLKTVTCDWPSGNEIGGTKLADDNAVKLALYHAVVSGKGVMKAKKDCATIEGDPLPIYATAKGGKIKIAHDYSRDRFMSFKGLIKLFGGNSYSTRKVEIGYLDQGKFIPLSSAAPKDMRLFLRLKGEEYF